MNYTWTVVNQDKNTIQFCVTQSGGYSNCASIPGSSTLPFTIPDIDVQIYGTPVNYYVYYTDVGVKTSPQSLPSNGSTITIPPYTGCIPFLTQGQGYPPIVPCTYPGIIFIKSESTPAMFVENWGAVEAGFQYGYGVQGGPLALATGPNWQYYKQYPSAKVYLIGNWQTQGGKYVDLDSGKVYCGCSGASVYIIPNSALPGPPSGTTGGTSGGTSTGTKTGITGGGVTSGGVGTTSGGGITTTTTQTTTTQITTQGELKIYNQCNAGITAYVGNTIVYVGPRQSASVVTTFPTTYTLISQSGQIVGQGTASGGEVISPRDCPSVGPSSSPSTTPSVSSTPLGILILLAILAAIAMGGGGQS